MRLVNLFLATLPLLGFSSSGISDPIPNLGDAPTADALGGSGGVPGFTVADPRDNPNNPDNSIFNPDNSPRNPENSRFNPDNSPVLPGNSRVIWDNNGNAVGYAVPKASGGSNYYDYNGNRIGYENGR